MEKVLTVKKSESILLLNPGPSARVIIPTKGAKMATKTKGRKSKKGKMPAGLKKYWAKMRENPKRKRARKRATKQVAANPRRRRAPRQNPGPSRSRFRGTGSAVKAAGKKTFPLVIDAFLGLLGYSSARFIANGAARFFPRKPTDTSDPFVLRMVGVVQFAAGAFLAIKVPKARGIGLGLCIAGIQDGIRRNVPLLAPYLGADDETLLAYQPIEAPVSLQAPVDLGGDPVFSNYRTHYMSAPVDMGEDDHVSRYGY